MQTTILNTLKNNFSTLGSNSQVDYKKKLFQYLSYFGIAIMLIRICFLTFLDQHNFLQTNFIINLTPLAILTIGLFLMSYDYNISKFMVLFLLPVNFQLLAIQNLDKSFGLLFLLFCILAFIFFDTIQHIAYAYVWNALLYTSTFLIIYYNSNNTANVKGILFTTGSSLIFFSVIFFLLAYLKTTVSFYMKRMSKDNDALVEINQDLLEMHNELIKKNAMLEKDSLVIDSNSKQLNKIVSVIAHDIKSPLVSVRNILNYTNDLKNNQESIVQYVPEITKTLNNTVSLLENLLSWSRNHNQSKNEIQQEIISFKTAINEVLDLNGLALKAKSIELVVENPTNAQITFNRPMLNSILRNLVSNAVKFTPIGGKITIIAIPLHEHVKIQICNEVDNITDETIQKLRKDEDVLFTGTAGETGSGFGLLLAKDFLASNNTELYFSQKNNKLFVCEFIAYTYVNTKLRAISKTENSAYRLSVR